MRVTPPLFGMVFLWFLLIALPPSTPAVTITVDVAVREGAVTHRANGYLVSMEPDNPSTDLIAPLAPTSFRGSAGHVFRNYDRLRRLGVDEFQLTLGLVFGELASTIFDINRIGEHGDYGPWIAHVHSLVDQVTARHLSVLWDIYNEPDRADVPIGVNDRLKEGWRLAYRVIKDRLPEAVIVGPSVAYYSELRPFLEWSRDQHVFPDVVAYHEYGDPADASGYLADLRDFLSANGLALPISVNEIVGQEVWTAPGYLAGVLASYERSGIASAMHACWPDGQDTSRWQIENTCDNPTLGGLLFVDRQSKRPGWHIYKAYADMQGEKVSAVTDSRTTHALAAADESAQLAHLLIGKYGEPDVEETRVVVRHVSHVPFLAGSRDLLIHADRIPDVGSAPLESPSATMHACIPIRDDRLEFVLPEFSRTDAYRVVMSPCPSPATAAE